MKKKIRVLIVDDSAVFREIILRGLSFDSNIEVVATATDPFDARDKIIEYQPDVMTCDVEMPKMNGIEFIRRLIPQYPIPIIVVSSVSITVFDALNSGAVDFVPKPDMKIMNSIENFIYELIHKVKSASTAKVIGPKPAVLQEKPDKINTSDNIKLIAIGASTGGTEAITRVLKNLNKGIPGIVIVQHIPPDFSRMFAERLNSMLTYEVKEAITGDKVEPNKVLIAPGDKHMKIVCISGEYHVECFKSEKVNGHCPSVDLLFDSVAREVGKKAIGVILTGMGYDGAKGLLAMKRKGARTIGQDEKSSVVFGMPSVAYNIGAVEKQISLDNIASGIYSMLR